MGKLKNYEIDALASKAITEIRKNIVSRTIEDITDINKRDRVKAIMARAKEITLITEPLRKELMKLYRELAPMCEGYLYEFHISDSPEGIEKNINEVIFSEDKVTESDVKNEIIIRNMSTDMDPDKLIQELVAQFCQ